MRKHLEMVPDKAEVGSARQHQDFQGTSECHHLARGQDGQAGMCNTIALFETRLLVFRGGNINSGRREERGECYFVGERQ